MEIIGHQRQVEELKRDRTSGNLAHAYLLSGKRHLGKSAVARWFASELLTAHLDKTSRKRSLELFNRNIHPDLLTLDQLWIDGVCTDWDVIAKSSNIPQRHRAKTRAKTNTISIDDIRALQERLHETPQEGEKLVCLIHSIERLHITAANALLKILEEPPKHVLFCCTTESVSSLPPTVTSRMRILHFSPVPRNELLPLLSSLPEEDRFLLLRVAEGCPGVILRCLRDAEELRNLRQMNLAAERFLRTPSLFDRFLTLGSALEEEGKERFFQHVSFHLRSDLHQEDAASAESASQSLRRLFSLLHTLQSNVNRQLLVAHAVLQCAHEKPSPLRPPTTHP